KDRSLQNHGGNQDLPQSRDRGARDLRRDGSGPAWEGSPHVFREGFKLQGGLHMKKSLTLAASAAALVTLSVGAYAAANWYPYKIEVWEKAFDMASKRHMMEYTPLEKASQKWKLCVSFPHMKDDYWLAVDYGAIDEAKRMGVEMQVLEAGGYTQLNKQISQIENCVAGGAQAVIIGAISFDGLNNLVGQLADKKIPV